MMYSGKRKNPYRLTLYVPYEKERVVKDFLVAIRARNESASQKIVDWIDDFMENNRLINPQTRLSQANLGPRIYKCKCGELASVQIRTSPTIAFYLCEKHYQEYRRSQKEPYGVAQL